MDAYVIQSDDAIGTNKCDGKDLQIISEIRNAGVKWIFTMNVIHGVRGWIMECDIWLVQAVACWLYIIAREIGKNMCSFSSLYDVCAGKCQR